MNDSILFSNCIQTETHKLLSILGMKALYYIQLNYFELLLLLLTLPEMCLVHQVKFRAAKITYVICLPNTICRQYCKTELVSDRNRKSTSTIAFLPRNTINSL